MSASKIVYSVRLTINADFNSFRHSRWYTVASDAQISTHVQS